ncbi:hypothetical protein H6784_05025 [Candidatus Nomurabacteria bacterium]|nr:hypothetical protein [Candidatus Nomurabacteria bacterium]
MSIRYPKRIDPNTIVLLKQIFLGVVVIGFVALLVTALWYVTRIQALTIVDVEVSGGETISHDEVESIARQSLEGAYVGLIPHAFSWLYPKTEMLENLQKIDRIHDINISRDGGEKLKIQFNEYTPRALWCNSVEGHDCAFVDVTGLAYAKAPELSGGSFLRFIRIESNYEINQVLLPEKELDDILLMIDLFANEDWYISHVEVDSVGDAFLKVVGGGELKVSLSQTPAETVDNFRTVVTSEKFTHIKPGNFQYIDLRFGNKVFVNEEEVKVESDEDITATHDEVE